ncbi:MAG: ATP cone domain-containing protein, partial [Acidobacteriota bacterium]
MFELRVVKRTGEVVPFDPERIQRAIAKAVQAVGPSVHGLSPSTAGQMVEAIGEAVVDEIRRRFEEFYPNVENIQDIVEKHLVRAQHYEIAKAYILYRAERQAVRDEARARAQEHAKLGRLTVMKRDGRRQLFNAKKIARSIRRAGDGLGDVVDIDGLVQEVIKSVYDEIASQDIGRALVLAAASYIERDPAYSRLASRLLRQRLYKEVMGRSLGAGELDASYRTTFLVQIRGGVESGILHADLGDYDLDRLAEALDPTRDDHFEYLGMQTLYERYLLRADEVCLELPQAFWMRVAMG